MNPPHASTVAPLALRRKRTLWNMAGIGIAFIAVFGALWFWTSSREFEVWCAGASSPSLKRRPAAASKCGLFTGPCAASKQKQTMS